MASKSKTLNESGLIRLFASEVKVEQTLFALPFVFIGALLGSNFSLRPLQIVLIITALVSARTFGMLTNRLIDRSIDRLNPRTANRHIVSGKISMLNAFIVLSFFLIVYLVSVYLLGSLPLKLSPLPLILFVVYPYTKRFTWLCHIFLGFTLGFAPFAGWVAVSEAITIVPFLLGLATSFWVAGFDIYYATMDVEFDREHEIYSLPARFGIRTAARTAFIFHFLSITALLSAGLIYGLGVAFYAFTLLAFLFLLYNDAIYLRHLGTPRINEYLQINSYFSVIVFVGVIADWLLEKA